ncbi:polymorphic outer membrane protein middle domain-containing protein [Candidatus Chlamydia sanziniae]|uniref:Polymorphic membrane protein A Family n=1 Tax=Candidatus Chlamydia sanziniae TaxID=1806891 RepID=A0A1A9HWB6_9CHLA|nr:polymorphic outer membrane protein middle domain-containing protein [Candidatus Chlamydia sanziniae]ANH78334.1 polymorphic membrane protein A Family [Candidatus Chlamydia sanziniae]
MHYIQFWRLIFFSLSIQVSYVIANEVFLPLSGIHSGEDPQLFTLISSSPNQTTYSIRKDLILCDFPGKFFHKHGGAFRNLQGELVFTNATPFATLTFRNLCLGAQGVGVFSHNNVTFKGLRSLTADNNESLGGVLSSEGDLSFLKNHRMLFQNNISSGSGGAILLSGTKTHMLLFQGQQNTIAFLNNKALTTNSLMDICSGGAVSNTTPGGEITFTHNANILFQNNEAVFGGGLSSHQGTVMFSNNLLPIIFLDNQAQSGGAIYASLCHFSSQQGPIFFTNNKAQNSGGAIHATTVLFEDNDAPIVFEGNSATRGGAITTTSCHLTAKQSMRFINNTAFNTNGGGAIYLEGPGTRLFLHAHCGDIEFYGNTVVEEHKQTKEKNNAIFIKGHPHSISLKASQDHRLVFYDPVVMTTSSSYPLHINDFKDNGPAGNVIFSGARLSPQQLKNQENKTSIFNQPVHLHSGVLSIEGGAILAVQEFSQYGGVVTLGPGSLLTTYNNDSKKSIAISHFGFNLENLNSNLPAEIRAPGPIIIRFLEKPEIYDPYRIFYENHEQASKTYELAVVIKSKKVVTAPSHHSAGSDLPMPYVIPNSPYTGYGYQGSWSFSWSFQNDTKKKKTLKASWHPTGEFILNPERIGKLVPTTLWSTFSGLHATYNAVINNYLNNNVVIPVKHLSIFGGPISSLVEQSDSSNSFSLKHQGHTVGLRLPFFSDTILCAAFSQLHGSSSQKNIPAKIHSHTLLGTLALTKNWRSLSLRSSLSYTEDSQVMKHPFQHKGTSRGSWRNYGWGGTVGISYAYPKGIRWLKITPFIDLDYTALTQNAFVETGYDPRYFASSTLCNVSLPTGIALELRLFGMHSSALIHMSMAYIKDLHRTSPRTSASLVLNQHAWEVPSISVGQEAINVKVHSTVKYKALTMYLGISSTQREGNNLATDAHAGLSLSF